MGHQKNSKSLSVFYLVLKHIWCPNWVKSIADDLALIFKIILVWRFSKGSFHWKDQFGIWKIGWWYSKWIHYQIYWKNLSKNATSFGLKIRFERSTSNGILINYHLMCAILAMAASINFLIDPKVVPGRAGLLVTLFLVMTGFFSDAQVTLILEKLHLPKLYKALIL